MLIIIEDKPLIVTVSALVHVLKIPLKSFIVKELFQIFRKIIYYTKMATHTKGQINSFVYLKSQSP